MKQKSDGRFGKEPALPQSKGLRLPADTESIVQLLAQAGEKKRSTVIRELLAEALAARADKSQTATDLVRIVGNHHDEQARRMQALSTIEQGAIVRLERQVTQLGANLVQRLESLETRYAEDRKLVEAIVNAVAQVQIQVPNSLNRVETIAVRMLRAVEDMPPPAGPILQKLEEVQSMCEGVHDELIRLVGTQPPSVAEAYLNS